MYVVACVLGNEHSAFHRLLTMCLRKEKEKGSILGETDQGFGEADLPEHLIARNRPFPRCVEENVSLLL